MVGICQMKEAAWYFDKDAKRCRPFYYTGCGGNDNRFLIIKVEFNAITLRKIPSLFKDLRVSRLARRSVPTPSHPKSRFPPR